MPMFKKSLMILFVLALAVLGGTLYGYYLERDAVALDEGTLAKAETPRSITVYVTGEVKKPGLVTLTEGQRVAGKRRGRCDRDGGHRPRQYGGVP